MKSRHGLPVLRIRLQNQPVVDNGKIVRAEAAQGKTNQWNPVPEGLLWLGLH